MGLRVDKEEELKGGGKKRKIRKGKNALAAGNAFACPALLKTASGPIG
jgi:hypothetical protein